MEAMLHSPRMDYTRIMQILSRVCRYGWFSAEFRAAGGLEWLIEKFPATKKNQAATLICLSLDFAEDELDIVSWVEELYNLLVSYKTTGGFQEPEMFVDAVERVCIHLRGSAESLSNRTRLETTALPHTTTRVLRMPMCQTGPRWSGITGRT
jgi:hypothetical protein